MTSHRILFVGGASGAGKTTAAQALGKILSLPCLELDELQRWIMPAIPEGSRRVRPMRNLAKETVALLLQEGTDVIVEGSWLEMEALDELCGRYPDRFLPVIVGYAGESSERARTIEAGGRHWLSREGDLFREEFIRQQLAYSVTAQALCGERGIPYIDFTVIERGVLELQSYAGQVFRRSGYDAGGRLPPLPEQYAIRMARHAEAATLISAGSDSRGREAFLTPKACTAWLAMRAAAAAEGVDLELVSAFRSLLRQERILKRKLVRGLSWDEVLRFSAYPGFSEHHSGRAIDIGGAGSLALEESFENTPAFSWLGRRAAEFGFRLSYPRNNDSGIGYEPWHWCYARVD